MIKEHEQREHGKIQQREIARKRLEQGYKRDKMEAISSADYEQPEDNDKKTSPSKGGASLDDMLNSIDSKGSGGGMKLKGPSKNTF
jgi:hypothetical protein